MSASLGLLSKKKAAAPAAAPKEEIKAAETKAKVSEPETVSADPDKMSKVELDKFVKDNGVEVAESWGKMTLAQKRTWLKETYGETEEEEAEPAAATKTEVVESETKKNLPAAPAKAPKAKAPTAASSKKSAQALVGSIEGPNELTDVVHTIENLLEKDAKSLIGDLSDSGGFNDFKLGGMLSKVQKSGWYTPYASFQEFIEKETPVHYRKAMYWVGIYDNMIESGVSWDAVKHLGWTKLQLIAGVMTTENYASWVEIAEKQTVLQLTDTVKNSAASKQPQLNDGTNESSSPTIMVGFKLHADQKVAVDQALEKAKEQSGTKVNAAALEYICLDFMGGAKLIKPVELLKSLGLPKAVAALAEAFPDAGIEAIDDEEKADA